METEIVITNFQTKDRINRVRVRELAELVMAEEGLAGELYITFLDNKEMKAQNLKMLGRNEPTDVIACNLKGGPDNVIGEIMVSAETAKKTALKMEINYEDELLRYLTHGILHLSGYMDEVENDREKMWERQEELLGKFLGRKPQ